MARPRDRRDKPGPPAGLTPQERRIREPTGEGLTNRRIGGRLLLAEKTAKNSCVSVLLAKLGIERTRAAYAARAVGGPAAK